MNKKDNKIILARFKIKKQNQENKTKKILFIKLIFAMEKDKIKNKKYAPPAIHALIISIE
jgi:hypothetical protein